VNIKVILNYGLVFLISIGLVGCKNDFDDLIVGANTPATFSGDVTGSTSDSTAVTGTLSVTDPDRGEASVQAQTDVALTFGSFSINSSGQWTYTLDTSNAAFQALNADETESDSITVSSVDRATQTITITVNGVNDSAVLGEGDGVDSASLLNNASEAVTGVLSLTDVDSTPDTIIAQTDFASTYGTFSIADDGAWTYTLDTTNSDVQGLVFGATPLMDVISVSTADGLSTDITLTINGAGANTPATFSGDLAGSIDSGAMEVTGTVAVTDPDTGEDVIVAQPSAAQTYGSFSIGTDGAWTYVLDNTNTEVQELLVGATLTDTIAIASADQTSSSVVITINGIVEVATQAAVIRDTLGTDTGELRYDIDNQLSGRLEVSYDRTGNTATDASAFISLLNSTGSTSSGRSIVDMRIRPSSFEFRDQTFAIANGVAPTPGTLQTVVITWTAPDAATPPTVTVTVDGVNVVDGGDSFTSAAAGIGGVERIQFRYGSNGDQSAATDTFTINSFEVFSDTAGTNSVFADDFSTYTVGNSLDPNADATDATATVQEGTPYNSSSSEVVVEEL